MRINLCILFIITGLLHVSAGVFAQKITLKKHDASLIELFKNIQEQSGYDFVYSNSIIETAHKVTIDVKNASIEETLKICFEGQPFSYTLENKTIVVKKNIEAPEEKNNTMPAIPIEITGKITDETGQALPGATVTVKGTSNSTVTDAKGNFTLKHVDNNAVLKISFIGYLIKEINANSDLSNIKMEVANSKLDEVKVIAYGITSERLSTGDVATVSAKEIEEQPVDNPLLALEGRVPGLFITQATGLPGSGVTVQIRGQNSIYNGNDPFYVIDGVPFISQLLPGLDNILGSSGGGFGSQYGNPMNFLNPSDIESISVLKDADATAIYGSRAANGAILITTKKGKAGETKVNLNIQNGWGQVADKLDLLNTSQYIEMRNEALKNDGLTAGSGDYDINGTWDQSRFTDWQKVLTGGTSQYRDLNATISGGNTSTQYLVGATDHYETTVFPGDFSDQKASLHFSINSSSANQKFHLQLTGSYLVDNNQLPQADLTYVALTLAPDAPPLYNKDGTINWAPTSSGTSSWTNPIATLYNKYQNKTNNLIGNALLSYQILPGLEIKSSFGYTNLQSNETVIFPLTSIVPENRLNGTNSSQFGNNNINSWVIEPQLSYNRNIGKAKLDVLIGSTAQQTNSNGLQLYGYGYNSDQLLQDLAAAPNTGVISATNSVYKYNALFGRVNYNLDDRYILDFTARRDGSSRFGAQNEFHNFGAIGSAWVFSNEGFIKKALPFISFGKIKASYGTTGSDQIGNYSFLNLYYVNNSQIPYQGKNGLQTYSLPNPYLQWEETNKLEFGMDIGLLKDRVLLSMNYYQNRSSNELLGYTLPIITGFNFVSANFPATVQNSGLEFTLSTTNIKSKDFSWSTHFNITIPQNKLIAFPNLATSGYENQLVLGQPLSIIKTYHFLGIDPSTGLYEFSDGRGGATTTPYANPSIAQTSLINTSPKFYGGFQNSFHYRGFELDVLFQYVSQIGPNYYFGPTDPGIFNGGEGNQPSIVLNRWQQPGETATHQRFNSDYSLGTSNNLAMGSDAGYSDASFIRLKNLSFSWEMPKGWLSKVHLQNARLYLQGQNLLTFTHYIGLDPETRSSSTLPPLKVITLGVQITL